MGDDEVDIVILAICIVVLAIYLSFRFVRKMNWSFRAHMRCGQTVIVGYDSDSKPERVRFSVIIPALNDNARYKLEG